MLTTLFLIYQSENKNDHLNMRTQRCQQISNCSFPEVSERRWTNVQKSEKQKPPHKKTKKPQNKTKNKTPPDNNNNKSKHFIYFYRGWHCINNRRDTTTS